MLNVQLLKNGEPALEFRLPETLGEVYLGAYIDFLVRSRSLLKLDDEEKDQTAYLSHMVSAVCAFCSLDTDLMLQANFTSDNASAVGTLSNLYGYISNIVSSTVKERQFADGGEFTFEYKGEAYVMPAFMLGALGGEVAPNLSVIEVIEAAEVQRLRQLRVTKRADPDGALRKRIMDIAGMAAIEDPVNAALINKAAESTLQVELEAAGDPKGNEVFGFYLRLLAILCRRKGERLPFDDAERAAWIDQRANHFKEIDAHTALQLDFFLTTTLQFYKKGLHYTGFLTLHSFAVAVEMRLKRPKHTKGKRIKAQKHSSV